MHESTNKYLESYVGDWSIFKIKAKKKNLP